MCDILKFLLNKIKNQSYNYLLHIMKHYSESNLHANFLSTRKCRVLFYSTVANARFPSKEKVNFQSETSQ